MLPAITGAGEATVVRERSAWPAAETVVVAVAVLLAGIGSLVMLPAVTVSVMRVPLAVPAFTFRTSTN